MQAEQRACTNGLGWWKYTVPEVNVPGAHSDRGTRRVLLDIRSEKTIGFALHRASMITLSILIFFLRALRSPGTVCSKRTMRPYLNFEMITLAARWRVVESSR